MCLALSQLSLDREVCPRLRDSNLRGDFTENHVPLKNTPQLELISVPGTAVLTHEAAVSIVGSKAALTVHNESRNLSCMNAMV